MNIGEFESLLTKPDSTRTVLEVGQLLVVDSEKQDTLNTVIVLKALSIRNPGIFEKPDDIKEWLQDDRSQQLVPIFEREWKWDETKIRRKMKEALQIWNKKDIAERLSRHEYCKTLSICDWVEIRGDLTAFSALHRLCLWSFGSLKELGPLPIKLQMLDLRHARSLTKLPPNLPATLETLDLTGCESLVELPLQPLKNLKRLFLGRCKSLTQMSFDRFWQSAQCQDSLEELEIHENPNILHLPGLGELKAIRILRMGKCGALRELPQWKSWKTLEHLDLRGCVQLETLPELPVENLQFLGLYGSYKIRRYLGQDLNDRDLGLAEGDDRSDLFRLRTQLGWAVQSEPRCKLLLLGNGEVGKTTLAKALQWREVQDSQKSALRERLCPRMGEDRTHGIHHWQWKTEVPDPDSRNETIQATIQIWDFGGQETYHGTHRIFAASGALFGVVEKSEGHLAAKSRDSTGKSSDKLDDLIMGRRRPVEYWLDYIQDLDRSFGDFPNTPARVLLVNSHFLDKASERKSMLERCQKRNQGKPEKFVKLEKQEEQVKQEKKQSSLKIQGEYWVGSLEHEWKHSDFEKFRTELKEQLGAQVREEGIQIPTLFVEIMKEIRMRVEKVRCISDVGALLTWNEWKDLLRKCCDHSQVNYDELKEGSLEALTAMLHQAGDLFWMPPESRLEPVAGSDQPSNRVHSKKEVILSQALALEEIYCLLNDFGVAPAELDEGARERRSAVLTYREEIRNNYGVLDGKVLREKCWPHLSVEIQDQLLEFMEKCLICVRLFPDSFEGGVVSEPILALDPVILKSWNEDFAVELSHFKVKPEDYRCQWSEEKYYELKDATSFCESRFRKLQAHAAQRLKSRGRHWVNGFQFGDQATELGFRVGWTGKNADQNAYAGYLTVKVWSKGSEGSENEVEQRCWGALRELIFGPSSPYPWELWDFESKKVVALEVGSGCFGDLRYDLSQSVRGVQEPLANKLEQAVSRLGGVNTFLYTTDKNSNTIDDVFQKIQTARVQVLWLSTEYLESSVENQYSLIELARAILTWNRARGINLEGRWDQFKSLLPNDSGRVVLIYLNHSGNAEEDHQFIFRTRFLRPLVEALEVLRKHFLEEFGVLKKNKVNRTQQQRFLELSSLMEAAEDLSGPFIDAFCLPVNSRPKDCLVFSAPRPTPENPMAEKFDHIAKELKKLVDQAKAGNPKA